MHLGLLFIFIPFFFILEKSCLGWQAIFVIQIKRKQIAFIFNGRSKEKANRPVVRTSSKQGRIYYTSLVKILRLYSNVVHFV